MINIYDDGYYMLGQVDDLKKYINNLILHEDGDVEEEKEMLTDLTDNYADTDVLLIYYDAPMGYYVDKVFNKGDVVRYD